MNIDKDLHKLYFGYYYKSQNQKTLLGISKNKSIMKNYLENHRGLNPNEYVIESERTSEGDILVKYDDYLITEYGDYYIPNIDQTIIDLYSSSIDMEIVNTINQLKHIVILSTDIKKISIEESEILVNAIKVLTRFRKKPKILNKLNKQYSITHSLLYCDIKEYLNSVSSYKSMVELDRDYRNVLMKD